MRIWRNTENFLHSCIFPSLHQTPEVHMESKQNFPKDYLDLPAYGRYTLITLHSSEIMKEILICWQPKQDYVYQSSFAMGQDQGINR